MCPENLLTVIKNKFSKVNHFFNIYCHFHGDQLRYKRLFNLEKPGPLDPVSVLRFSLEKCCKSLK